MFKNRTFNTLAGLTIAVLAVLSISTSAFTQRTPSAIEDSHSSPLDWYFSHDHAILDGDNNVVPVANAVPSEGLRDNRLAPLDWYFSHDHAILDGDNNVVSGINIPINERYSALKDKQIERLDASVPAVPASAVPKMDYATMKDAQLEQFDGKFEPATLSVPAVPKMDGCGLDRNEPDC